MKTFLNTLYSSVSNAWASFRKSISFEEFRKEQVNEMTEYIKETMPKEFIALNFTFESDIIALAACINIDRELSFALLHTKFEQSDDKYYVTVNSNIVILELALCKYACIGDAGVSEPVQFLPIPESQFAEDLMQRLGAEKVEGTCDYMDYSNKLNIPCSSTEWHDMVPLVE